MGHELDSREYGCIVAGEAPALRLKVVVPTSAYAADVGDELFTSVRLLSFCGSIPGWM